MEIACEEARACEIMGCTADRLKRLRAKGKLKEIGRGWYAIEDLKACIESLRQDRDKNDNVIHLEDHESTPKKERHVGGQRGRPGYRTPEKLLRAD